MNSLTEPGATLAERSLGTMEKFFYLLNQTHPNHFAMVGEIVGPTEIGQWQDGLDQVGRHSALIWSRIERDSHDVPRFRPAPQGSIPLKVLAYNSGWTAEAGAQLAEPFDELQPPLLRATLLHDADRAIIVLAAHHSIADAMSLTFLLGDLLRAISGQKLVRSRETAAVERLVERKYGSMPATAQVAVNAPAAQRPPKELRRPDGSSPHVEALRMTATMTRSLRNRARAESTTVHAALNAALAAAMVRLAPDRCKEPLRILSPVDLRRRLLDDSDHLATCGSGAVLVDDGPRNVDLWSRARHLGQGFSSIRSPEALAAKVLAIDRMLTGVNASAEARVVFTHVFGRDAVITNLGVVNLPRNYGPLALQAVWGPCVAAGFAGEPVIGAATFGDHLHLLHTSYGAIKGLLDQMVAEITLALTRRC